MAHGDLAQIAALIGAAGTALVLVPRGRLPLAAGFGLIVVAEVAFGVSLVPRSDVSRLDSPAIVAGLVVVALAVLALAAGLRRWAALVPVVLLLAAPFRLPVDLGSQHAFLLLPLYAVLAAACLELLARASRGPVTAVPTILAVPAAAFVVLDCISLLWAQDLEQGSIELAFFVVPFAALLAVVARAPFRDWLPRVLTIAVVALACAFSVIGLWQEWTRTVFFAQDLRVANTYASFFRVTSVFKDPSIYGRHLVLAIALLLVALWLRKIRVIPTALLIALIFAGLYFSYSQSSMAVLFVVALAVSAVLADRRSRVVLAAVGITVIVAAGVAAGMVAQEHSLRHATSGRSRLVRITGRVIVNHPVVGVGVGSQPAASRDEAKTRLGARKDASHTTPLTVTAELGVIGLLLYGALLAASARLLQLAVRRRRAAGLGLATAFLVLFLHSLFYSGFFEDPMLWGTLGLAAAVIAAPATQRAVEPLPATDLATDLASRTQPSRAAEPAPKVLEHP
jgi:hypothetical protein